MHANKFRRSPSRRACHEVLDQTIPLPFAEPALPLVHLAILTQAMRLARTAPSGMAVCLRMGFCKLVARIREGPGHRRKTRKRPTDMKRQGATHLPSVRQGG